MQQNLYLMQSQAVEFIYNFVLNNNIGFVALVLLIYSNLVRSSYSSLLGAWVGNFIGVFFHELAHALVGLILGAKPVSFIIVPKKEKLENGRTLYTLGNVGFKNLNWFNTFPTAMAPLLLFFIAYMIELYYWDCLKEATLLSLFLYIYLLIVFIVNAIPSGVDFKTISGKGLIGVPLWFLFFLVILKYL